MAATITGDQTGTVGLINAKTVVVSTSGTSIDFTGIPAGVKRITVMFAGVSTSGTIVPLVQLGSSGGIETSGYLGCGGYTQNAGASGAGNYTNGFGVSGANSAASVYHGHVVLTYLGTSNTWIASGVLARSDAAVITSVAGSKSLSGTLDRVRITCAADTFDAGSINILYE